MIASSAAPTRPATVVDAMHARFEAAWSDDGRLEAAAEALDVSDNDDRMLKFRYEEARKHLGVETDTLQRAILYQTPTTWRDALIIQYHVWSAFDYIVNSTPSDEAELAAIASAMDAVFDFMACNVPDVDHEAVGPMFKSGTMLAWRRRQHRTADLEG